MQAQSQALETRNDEASLLDLCGDLVNLGNEARRLRAEAELYAEPIVCQWCKPRRPCWFHATFEQRQQARLDARRPWVLYAVDCSCVNVRRLHPDDWDQLDRTEVFRANTLARAQRGLSRVDGYRFHAAEVRNVETGERYVFDEGEWK